MNCTTHTNGPGRTHRCHTFKLTEPGVKEPQIQDGFQQGPYLEAYDRYIVVPKTEEPGAGDALDVASATAGTINWADGNAYDLRKQDVVAAGQSSPSLLLAEPIETSNTRRGEGIEEQTSAVLLPDGSFGIEVQGKERVNEFVEGVFMSDVSRQPRWRADAPTNPRLDDLESIEYTEHSRETRYTDQELLSSGLREQHVNLNPGTGTLTVCADIYRGNGHMPDFNCGRGFLSSPEDSSPMHQHSRYTTKS